MHQKSLGIFKRNGFKFCMAIVYNNESEVEDFLAFAKKAQGKIEMNTNLEKNYFLVLHQILIGPKSHKQVGGPFYFNFWKTVLVTFFTPVKVRQHGKLTKFSKKHKLDCVTWSK